MNGKRFMALGILAVVVIIGLVLLFQYFDDPVRKLNSIVEKANAQVVPARKAQLTFGSNELKDELPDINTKYPQCVQGTGEINIEIFTSPEKGDKNKKSDSWMVQMGESFNNERFTVNGKIVSITLRSIPSGLQVDYIITGIHIPQAITPSNEFWASILKSKNVKLDLYAKRMVGNTAGLLLSSSTYNSFMKKYGKIDIKAINDASSANEISMGVTFPFTSSTGLNYFVNSLYSYDPLDIFSDKAISGLEAFQASVPFLAQTTQHMADAASNGMLDAFITEYQTYANRIEFKSYVYTPFGVRHDNPMYSVGNLTNDQAQVLKMFVDYCLTEKAQAIATECGFNQLDSYVSDLPSFSGEQLLAAQSLWKEKKDSGQPVIGVFVADVSNSMNANSALTKLKTSLLNSMKYINSENYIGLVSYNDTVKINLPIGKFDINQMARFQGAVEDMSASGNTASYDATMVALDMLLKAKEQIPNAKLMLFVLTDGDQNVGNSLGNVTNILEYYKIPTFTIGYNLKDGSRAKTEMEKLGGLNESTLTNADSVDVVYQMKNLFNSQM